MAAYVFICTHTGCSEWISWHSLFILRDVICVKCSCIRWLQWHTRSWKWGIVVVIKQGVDVMDWDEDRWGLWPCLIHSPRGLLAWAMAAYDNISIRSDGEHVRAALLTALPALQQAHTGGWIMPLSAAPHTLNVHSRPAALISWEGRSLVLIHIKIY